jgi:hypothetical protein
VTAKQLREQSIRELTEPGQRRRALMDQLAEVDQEIRPLVIRAVDNGVPQRTITQLTGVAGATIRSWYRAAQQTSRPR